MNALLLAAVWVNLAACISLVGSFSLLLLAGTPESPAMRRWEAVVLRTARWTVVVALISGIACHAARAALFEGRPGAALAAGSLLHAMLDTWPGQVWMLRHGLLVLLAAFLWFGQAPPGRWDRVAARVQGLLLASAALIVTALSSHAAAISEDRWPRSADLVHLLGAGLWAGGLPPLALLLFMATRGATTPDAYAVRAIRRFSRLALVTVLALAATGVAVALLLVEGLPGLVGTTHGHLLLAKLGLLLAALALAAATRARLPALTGASGVDPTNVMRRMARWIAFEAVLVAALIGFAAAMTTTTPARHGEPVWPWPVRLQADATAEIWRRLEAAPTVAAGALVLLAVIVLVTRRRRAVAAGLLAVTLAGTAAIALPPWLVEALPTSYTRTPVTYHVGSISAGKRLYASHCAACHDRSAARTAQRTAGELFWWITHGRPETGMPAFEDRLDATQRWHVVNYLRAIEAATSSRDLTPSIRPDDAWLVAPDFAIAIGPLVPHLLREVRGRRLVLLVLYSLPESAQRMAELARRYATLSVLGVEIVAVAPRSSAAAIAELVSEPPAFFPIVTAGNEDIDATYRLFAPGTTHAEFLIDRQGYIRAIWRGDPTGMPDAPTVQAEVERLNEEKAPPALPDDHIH